MEGAIDDPPVGTLGVDMLDDEVDAVGKVGGGGLFMDNEGDAEAFECLDDDDEGAFTLADEFELFLDLEWPEEEDVPLLEACDEEVEADVVVVEVDAVVPNPGMLPNPFISPDCAAKDAK